MVTGNLRLNSYRENDREILEKTRYSHFAIFERCYNHKLLGKNVYVLLQDLAET
jgi:hypothetical protein